MSIDDKVCDSVRGCVWESVLDSVDNSVQFSVYDFLNDYEYTR